MLSNTEGFWELQEGMLVYKIAILVVVVVYWQELAPFVKSWEEKVAQAVLLRASEAVVVDVADFSDDAPNDVAVLPCGIERTNRMTFVIHLGDLDPLSHLQTKH